ncbi:MAG: hypothetical protein HY902_01145 [Deltaproteobacteria bacterium]|nr:hypothetical protein [Deltaproteobacteria bacterium]
MNKGMPTVLRGLWLALLAAVLVASVGCQRPAKCYEDGVVCADEFDQTVAVGSDMTTWYFGQAAKPITVTFSVPDGATASVPLKYFVDVTTVIEGAGEWSWGDIAFQAGKPIATSWPSTFGRARYTYKLMDADKAYGTEQTAEICIDDKGKQQDCKAWAATKLPDPVTITNDNALTLAPNIRCGKLAYQESDSGDVQWSDLTWTVRSPASYDMGKVPNARGQRYGMSQPGPFVTKPLDTVEMLGKKPEAAKWPASLTGRVATDLRLPLRFGLAELVNTNKNNPDVLRAGWAFTDTASGKEVNVGCAIKQTVLADIISTALAGQPIGEQTVHILFNAASDKQPVGENGWCYKVTGKGQSPLLKPYASTESGKPCANLL